MEGLSINNFKSYRKHTVFGFNPYLNVIIGGNGQGKSNIFKALSFVLSDRLQINRTEFRNCLHRGFDVNEEKQIEVEVVMREKSGSDELAKVAKVWKPSLVQQCFINSKLMNKREYENFVDSLGLGYTNPYNIIQQGKINQITLMDQFELYKLLQEITGVKKFTKRKEEALAIMKKVQLQKSETKAILDELDSKLKSLESRKEEFQFFAMEEKTKKFRTKKHLNELLQSTRHNLDNIKSEYNEVCEGLAKIVVKKRNIEQSIDDANIFIKISRQKLAMADRTDLGITQSTETQELRELEKKQKQLHKQLKQRAKAIKQKDKEVENFKKSFNDIEQRYETMKLNRKLQKPKEGKEKIISAFESELKMDQERLDQIQGELQKTQKKIQEIQKILKNKKNMENLQQHQKLQSDIEELRQRKAQNRKSNAQLAWQRNVTTIQVQSLKDVVQQSQMKMKKFLPNLDFNLIAYLRQQNVRGVYGYFIQFVKIDESVAFAYEIAGLTKLCSLLVENEEACTAVIEANRKLKGRQINIIQLDYVRGRPAESQSIPKSQNVRKLSNNKWIKIDGKALESFPDRLDQDIQKLIKNTFDKYAVVKDYETGLRVSKEFHLNCITGDREIVYSEGYHCKLGQENIYHESNLQLFYKFQERQQAYAEKLQEKRRLESKITQNQNQEVILSNSESKLQIDLQKLASSANELTTQAKMLEIYLKNIEQLTKSHKDSEQSLKKKKQTLQMLTSTSSKTREATKMSKKECEELQILFHQKRKQLNKMLTQIYEIEEEIQKLTTEKEQIDNEVLKVKNNKEKGFVNTGSIINEIEKHLDEKFKEVKDLEKELEDLNRIEKDAEGNKNHVEVKLITYRSEEEDIEGKIGEIGEFEEDIEELQELSNSMSVSMLHGKKRNHYFSTKDKLLFTKFANILESFKDNKKTFKDLEEAENKIKGKIAQYEGESEEYMSEIAQKFEKQFKQIFTFLVNQGHSQVRLKKVSEKVKDTIKYKNCLTIRVNFSTSGEAMKKWNDFSGGQKTVIAISMILALQRCEPAPFYVLDEIDSALDSVYVQKIAQLLARQCQKNKCQYFISSFKEDMLNFPQEICNYYLVTSENRESSMEKIRQSRAIDALKSIVMKP